MQLTLEVVPPDVVELRTAVDEALAFIDTAAAYVEKSLGACLRAGAMLRRKRLEMDHGQWYAWLETNVSAIRRETARKWIKLAEFAERFGPERLESAGSIRKAYELVGLIPEADGGAGRGSSSGLTYLQHLERCQRVLPIGDLESLPREDKVVLKERLRPYVDLYERL